MKRLLTSVIDVRRGEVGITLLMAFYYYLVLVTYYFLKPARDSLFLVKLGPDQLPFVFMLIAVIIVPVTTIYSRAGRSLKLNKLINITTLILIVGLLVLRWLLGFTHPAVYYLFYIWVSIYGALSTAQFWLLANGMFDATQAKRVFGLFSLAGIVGAFTGGEVTSIFVNTFNVSTENLIFFCIAFLLICIGVVNAVWRRKQQWGPDLPVAPRRQAEQKESFADIFKTIKRSRYLILIVAIIAMTMATGTFVDFQFKTVSAEAFTLQDDLTSFLGKFYGRVSLVAFLFQLLVSYRLLRRFGVGGAILLLPLGLLGGSVLMFLMPGLLAAIILRGSDGVLRFSIDKTGRELLFLPIPLDVKKRTKVFIDIFVDRWFRGMAGALLLLFVVVLNFSVRQLSIVVFALLGLWLFTVFLARREYVNAFRRALERREIDLSELRTTVADAATLNTLRAALSSGRARRMVYALQMLSGAHDPKTIAAVRPLVRDKSADVRRHAVEFLRTIEDRSLIPDMTDLLSDADDCIRRDAVYFLCRNADGDQLAALRSYLSNPEVALRSAAIGALAAYGTPKMKALIGERVIQESLAVEGAAGEMLRIQVAECLGTLEDPALGKIYLPKLLDDPSPGVVTAAIRSIGRTGDLDFEPELLDRLGDKRYRRAALEAFSMLGDRIVDTINHHIHDPSIDITIRSTLCRVLASIPTQHSVDTLIAGLRNVEPQMRFPLIKALNSLRARHPFLKFDDKALSSALIEETESYYAMSQIMKYNHRADTPAGKLLERALQERVARNLERIFRLLGLSYLQKDIYSAYLGITGDRKQLRANAIELLDNVLNKEVKRYLLPIVDNISLDFKVKKGQELFGLDLSDRVKALQYLINGSDPWLKACAIFSTIDDTDPAIRKLVEPCLDDPYPLIKETAQRVLEGEPAG